MMNWKWTWVNFVASLLLNRLRNLLLTQMHSWITDQPEIIPLTWNLEFYIGSLIVVVTFSLLRFCPLHYGVLLINQPEAAHVLQEGQVVPVLQNTPQYFTRKVFHSNKIKVTRVGQSGSKCFPKVPTDTERFDLGDPPRPLRPLHLHHHQVAALGGELCNCLLIVWGLGDLGVGQSA